MKMSVWFLLKLLFCSLLLAKCSSLNWRIRQRTTPTGTIAKPCNDQISTEWFVKMRTSIFSWMWFQVVAFQKNSKWRPIRLHYGTPATKWSTCSISTNKQETNKQIRLHRLRPLPQCRWEIKAKLILNRSMVTILKVSKLRVKVWFLRKPTLCPWWVVPTYLCRITQIYKEKTVVMVSQIKVLVKEYKIITKIMKMKKMISKV